MSTATRKEKASYGAATPTGFVFLIFSLIEIQLGGYQHG